MPVTMSLRMRTSSLRPSLSGALPSAPQWVALETATPPSPTSSGPLLAVSLHCKETHMVPEAVHCFKLHSCSCS